MRESLIIVLFSIISFLFIYFNNNNVVPITVKNDKKKYYVRNHKNKLKSAEILSEIMERLYKLRDYLYENIEKYPKFKEYILQLKRNLNVKRTYVYEANYNSNYTSYSVNKGEELVFCLKSKKQINKYHDINLLMYVALHELAHVACPELHHTPLFKKIFAFLTRIAIKLKLWVYENYEEKPREYCGMTLSSVII